VLKNKWYVDEFYQAVFIKPSYWIAETVIAKWIDGIVIDGILHGLAAAAGRIGHGLRNYIDKPIINEAIGDGSARATGWLGRNLRPIQTGRVQNYMMLALLVFMLVGGLLFYLLIA
jgi:NADH-quinone oxidoreductase subunit L